MKEGMGTMHGMEKEVNEGVIGREIFMLRGRQERKHLV